jgi:hypothetical protein
MVQAPLMNEPSAPPDRKPESAVRLRTANAGIATQEGSNYYSQTTAVLKKNRCPVLKSLMSIKIRDARSRIAYGGASFFRWRHAQPELYVVL